MSTPIRLAGSVLTLFSGAWAAYVAYYGTTFVTSCSFFSNCVLELSQLQAALFVVGAFLALDALVSFVGVRASFILGGVLSAAVLVIVAAQWGTYSATDSAVALTLSLLAVVADAVASRPVKAISEQTNPMNLPVFG